MPGFDAIYKQTVTLFNRKDVDGVTFWYPSVISGVHLVIDKSIIISTYGEQAQDNAMLHIQYKASGGDAVVETGDGSKVYMMPKVFRATGDPDKNITFAYGDNFDFIMSGVYSDETLRWSVKSEQEVTATIDGAIWRTCPLSYTGKYTFLYNGSVWTYGGAAINLSNYGIVITGTPVANDELVVVYVSANGPIPDDEYRSGFFNHMNKNYDEVFAITRVAKFNLIPHFEITAR